MFAGPRESSRHPGAADVRADKQVELSGRKPRMLARTSKASRRPGAGDVRADKQVEPSGRSRGCSRGKQVRPSGRSRGCSRGKQVRPCGRSRGCSRGQASRAVGRQLPFNHRKPRAAVAHDLWHCPPTPHTSSVRTMAALLTITLELALPGLLWLLWRELARADQEIETLNRGRDK